MPTPVERGPGSVGSSFTPPSVPVATPGRQVDAQPTEYERFRDAVLASAGGIASAVSARARINSRLKALKEQSVARVEGDLQRAARGLQQRRLESAVNSRQQILIEAETKGMEFAERAFRNRMVNASSAEESQLWERAWQAASSQVDRTNEETRRQQFNSAARTMDTVSMQLRQQLLEQPELEATLIGDGQGIAARVQDWMLTEIGAQVDLDSMTGDDADVLIHQAVKQSFGIADDLTRTHLKRVNDSNEILGTQQIEADFFSTLSGEQEASRLTRQVEVTLRDRLSHLTPEQQMDYVRRTGEEYLLRLANGDFGIDALANIGTAVGVLNLTVEGEPVFTDEDWTRLSADMLSRARSTAQRSMDGEIARLREEQTQVVTLPDGRTAHLPVLDPDAALIQPDPLTGMTPVDEAANTILSKMNLLVDDITTLSPEAALIVGSVRERAAAIRASAAQQSDKIYVEAANSNTVYSGEIGGDANKAHESAYERRAFMSPTALTAAKQRPLSGTELRQFQQHLIQTAEAVGMDDTAARQWDGRPIEYTEENLPLIRLVNATEALKWSNSDTQAQYGMPTSLVEDKVALLRSNDPVRLEAFSNFVLNLPAGANEGWDNFLTSTALTGNDAAAAQWVRTHARLGQAAATSGTFGNTEVEADFTQMVAQVQAIQNAAPIGGWFRSDTGDIELETSNAGNMAAVMAQIIGDETGARFEADERDRFNRRVQAQLQDMFLSDTNTTGRQLRNLWFAGRSVNDDLDDTQVGAMIWSWLKKDGHRWRSVNDRAVLVIDPQNYTGQQGQDIGEHVNDHFRKPFAANYRSFLVEALGVQPMDAPFNLQDMFLTDRFGDTSPFDNALTPRWDLNEQVTDRMLESRAGYGGFVISAEDERGVVMPPLVSKFDATLRWPDGTSVFVPAGTVLNVINPDLFALPDAVGSSSGTSPVGTGFSAPTVNRPQS
jgi:hypothetical protein